MSEKTSNQEQAVKDAASNRVIEDMPYVEITEVRLYQYHYQSKRWYVEVDVKHHDPDQGGATVLCKVWSDDESVFLKAARVTLVEKE